MLQLVPHTTTVTTGSSAPGHEGSVTKNDGKSTNKTTEGGLDLLHILQLVLHSTAVTTMINMTPSHYRPIISNQPLLSPPELASPPSVTTDPSPSPNGSISNSRSESTLSGLDLPHVRQLVMHSSHHREEHYPRSRQIRHQEWLQKHWRCDMPALSIICRVSKSTFCKLVSLMGSCASSTLPSAASSCTRPAPNVVCARRINASTSS